MDKRILEAAEQIAVGKGLCLRSDPQGLTLTDGKLEMRADLTSMLPRLKTSNLQREMLVKAVRIKGEDRIRVLDATAGMGEDSLILAAAGFEMDLYEYDPIIAALLGDSLERAEGHPELASVVSRMHLHVEDSILAMQRIAEGPDGQKPDVILLDPMFPARNKSALIKKKFQLLQQIESPCGNEAELLAAAMAVRARKIVIKRPLKGPYLADVKPSYSLAGKAIRYDCIL